MDNPLKGGYAGLKSLGEIMGTKKDLTDKVFGSKKEEEEEEEVEEQEEELEEEEEED